MSVPQTKCITCGELGAESPTVSNMPAMTKRGGKFFCNDECASAYEVREQLSAKLHREVCAQCLHVWVPSTTERIYFRPGNTKRSEGTGACFCSKKCSEGYDVRMALEKPYAKCGACHQSITKAEYDTNAHRCGEPWQTIKKQQAEQAMEARMRGGFR